MYPFINFQTLLKKIGTIFLKNISVYIYEYSSKYRQDNIKKI